MRTRNKDIPLVSIGLPTYQRGTIIHKAIDQLLSQTYKNIELIISDNASTDTTKIVCDDYTKKDHRVKYFQQKQNVGMYNNFNFVLSKAEGDYFLWATDDDVWKKDFVKKMVDLLNKYPSAVVATSNFTYFSSEKKIVTSFSYKSLISFPQSIRMFLRDGVLISYGVTRMANKKRVGKFYRYSWPIPDGIGEIIPVFRLLLQGDAAFSQERLWKKRDSGYAMESADILGQLNFSPATLHKIERYSLFPILFLYELCILVKDTLASKHTTPTKVRLLCFVLEYYFRKI